MASAAMPHEVYDDVKWNGWGSYGVEMTLDRESLVITHVNGKKIRKLVDFLHKEIQGGKGEKIAPTPSPSISIEEAIQRLPKPCLNQPFLDDVSKVLKAHQVRLDGKSRLTHIVGKNYRDLWRMRNGIIDRAPDAIILPTCHADCQAMMELAHKHSVVVIPFGGGTNVTGGIEPSPFEVKRMIVSVDMRRMTRMLSIDRESRTAVFETGVLGPDLDEQLGRHGFMLGHDPDSYLFSTLGGWIGARSSGAMSNKYGDIEDMVLAMKVATPTGVVETPVTARACGVDLNGLFIGSEGVFGIVTKATVKIEPIPDVKRYEGWFFPTFEAGYGAFCTLTSKGIHPCTLRLYDEGDTKMSMAMGTDHGVVGKIASTAVKSFMRNVKKWNMDLVSLVIIGFEGTKEEVAFQRKQVVPIFTKFGAMYVGRSAGNGWQEKKYDLPYIRDFALSNSHWADVLETTVSYSNAVPCWRAVKTAVQNTWKAQGKTGWIGCHTAHQYRSGCCLYFTYASAQKDSHDLELFVEIKKQATEALLVHGGTLTHHHGIGYEHVPWMLRLYGEAGVNLVMNFKRAVDPKNICNPGKLIPSLPQAGESQEATKARQEREMMFDKMGIPGAIARSRL